MIRFFVPGMPVPGGSKKAFPVRGRDGRTHVTVADTSGRKGAEWRAAIRHAAHAAHPAGPLHDALELTLLFHLPRPLSHLHASRQRIRRSAPPHPITRPDVLKLARAVEDALSGVLYRDDSQIVWEHLHKRYVRIGAPGVQVMLTVLDAERQQTLRLASGDGEHLGTVAMRAHDPLLFPSAQEGETS